MMKDNIECPVCKNTMEIEYYDYIKSKDNVLEENFFNDIHIAFCPACDFGWVTPSVNSLELEKYYTQVYRNLPFFEVSACKHNFGFYRNGKVKFRPHDARALSQMLLAKNFISFEAKTSFLDIGPGMGNSFQTFLQIDPSIECYAFEPDIKSRKFLEEVLHVKVFPFSFNSDNKIPGLIENKKFNCILMSHVLEHFNGVDVFGVLKNIANIITNDGVFICEVPHVDLSRHKNMRHLDTPHLSFFSVESIKLILEKANFEILYLNTCASTYKDWWGSGKVDMARVSPSIFQRCRRAIRFLYNALPFPVPKRILTALYCFLNPDAMSLIFNADDFRYGGDRTCIRVVARIKQNN